MTDTSPAVVRDSAETVRQNEANSTGCIYDAQYYKIGCGLPYERSAQWLQFFGGIADHIIRGIGPTSVLDAGCAKGFLVESLRDRGVEAFGVDISEYAVGEVREDVKPFCRVASLVDPLPHRYDLVVCIEVLEHMSAPEALAAVANLCRAADDLLISSSPSDFGEATHFNVHPPEYWADLFAQHGFVRDVEFDASFITAWAMRFRKTQEPLHRVIVPYERRLWAVTQEARALREQALESRAQREQWQAGQSAVQLENQRLAQENAALEDQLSWMKQTQGWRLLEKARGFKRRITLGQNH